MENKILKTSGFVSMSEHCREWHPESADQDIYNLTDTHMRQCVVERECNN